MFAVAKTNIHFNVYIHAYRYSHLICISNKQKHMHGLILKHSYTLNVYLHDNTKRSWDTNSRIFSDTHKIATRHTFTPPTSSNTYSYTVYTHNHNIALFSRIFCPISPSLPSLLRAPRWGTADPEILNILSIQAGVNQKIALQAISRPSCHSDSVCTVHSTAFVSTNMM